MKLATLLLASLLLLATRVAGADEATDREQAKVHFKAGKKHLDAKQYDQAIAEYQAAYQLVPIPEMLFNIGQAYRLKGDKLRAVEAYRKYLAVEPKGRGAAEAKQHIAALAQGAEEQRKAEEAEAARAAEDARNAEEARVAEERRKAEEARVAEERREAAEAGANQHDDDAGDDRDDRPRGKPGRAGRGLRIAGIVTGGAGLALAGLGVYFGLRAQDLQAQGEERLADGQWDPEVEQIIADGNAAERNMLVFTIAGGAAIVGGGLLYYLGHRAGERQAAGVAVVPTAGGAAVTLGGSW